MTVKELKELLNGFDPNCEVFVRSKKTKAKFGVLRPITGIDGTAQMDTNKWLAVLQIEELSDQELLWKALAENRAEE